MSYKRRKVAIDVPQSAGGTLPFAVYFPTGRPGDEKKIDMSVYACTGRGAQHVVVGSMVRDSGSTA